ncbi:MAG: hypothetical protein RRY40_03040 [Oscillospiraceae bacterium]
MKAKKILALILAIMLGLGALSPLVYLMSSAATFEIGSATSMGDYDIIKGTPDPNVFKEAGIYQFKVVKALVGSGFKIEYELPTKPGTKLYADINGSLFIFGGLTIAPEKVDTFQKGDTFKISILKAEGSAGKQDPGVTLINSDELGKIFEGKRLNLVFNVTDYNIQADEVDYSTPTMSFNGGGSFALQGGKNAAIAKGDGSRYAIFKVSIPVKYSGHGNAISFVISYDDNGGNSHFVTCSAQIPNTVETKPDEDKPEDDKVPDPLTPYIIVESYSYGGASVMAGEDFELTLNMRNTSDTHTLENIVMNISPQGVFSMGSSSNTIYIPTLFAGSTKSQKVTINTGLTKVTDDKDANSISMKFDFQYVVDKVRKTGTSNENITIPVNFPDRFELSPPEMDGTAYQGEDWYIYLPMVNKGRSSVYNLMAYVKGEGIKNAGQRQYVGNVNAGAQTGVDFTLKFTDEGPQKGEIIVTYEDANMNPKEVKMPFEVNVEAMFAPDMGNPDIDFPGGVDPSIPVEAEKKPSLPKKPIAVTAVVVCAISTYITILKAKAKRRIFSDEEI